VTLSSIGRRARWADLFFVVARQPGARAQRRELAAKCGAGELERLARNFLIAALGYGLAARREAAGETERRPTLRQTGRVARQLATMLEARGDRADAVLVSEIASRNEGIDYLAPVMDAAEELRVQEVRTIAEDQELLLLRKIWWSFGERIPWRSISLLLAACFGALKVEKVPYGFSSTESSLKRRWFRNRSRTPIPLEKTSLAHLAWRKGDTSKIR
jgi:hypothetical protein